MAACPWCCQKSCRAPGLGATGASLLTTLPIVCLGLFAAPAPALARRFGAERTLLGAMLLIGLGTLLRAWVSLPLLFASSVLAGAGIAIGNVLLLGLIKRDFPRRAAMMTGLYTLAICFGASIATAFTVPRCSSSCLAVPGRRRWPSGPCPPPW